MNTDADHRQTVFLLEEDDQTRQALLKNLRREGYRVLVAVDETSAHLSSSAYARVDLVLINVVGKSLDEALRIGRAIRDAGKFQSTRPLPREIRPMEVSRFVVPRYARSALRNARPFQN